MKKNMFPQDQTPGSRRSRVRPRTHFRFSTLSGAMLLIVLAVGIAVAVVTGGPVTGEASTADAGPATEHAASDAAPTNGAPVDAVVIPEDIAVLAGSVVVAGVLIAVLPFWPVVLVGMIVVVGMVGTYASAPGAPPMIAATLIAAVGVLVAPSCQIANQWEKVVVLRWGRFRRAFGAGPHLIMPLADTIVRFTDMRIRVTDFSAEKSITRDTVPVHVDALAFWLVWDAAKAMLEVENYVDAVTLSAQTALRDAIGRSDLATLLSERERLGSEIQSILDRKTDPWGITVLSIELKEVLVPKELEDALSRKAQAEREHQSRVILAGAEVEIAKRFEEAAHTYAHNETAFQLRAMNMAYDSIRTNKNIVLMPSSALESVNLGTSLGAAAFARRRHEGEPSPGGTHHRSDVTAEHGHEDADPGSGADAAPDAPSDTDPSEEGERT